MSKTQQLVVSVFLGSTRKGRQGKKLADWTVDQLQKKLNCKVHLLDPVEYPKVFTGFTERYSQVSNPSEEFTKVRNWVNESDGYILISPEYNHSYSGAIKNMIDLFFKEYENKPFGIISYSGGPFGGIRATESLRLVVSELGAVSLPYSLPVTQVWQTFDETGPKDKETWDPRLDRLINQLAWYMEALKSQREKNAV